jgi:hypothetical protein
MNSTQVYQFKVELKDVNPPICEPAYLAEDTRPE